MDLQDAAPVRLVVADDSLEARKAIEAIVHRAPGFELVGSATSGEEAIELVGWLQPDLALFDVRMPGVGGIEAARAISATWPETAVVLVSALEEDELPTTIRRCGAAAVIHKSAFTARTLAEVWRCRGESAQIRSNGE